MPPSTKYNEEQVRGLLELLHKKKSIFDYFKRAD